MFDIKSDSAVYFLQEVENQNYELLFGDGVFGKALEEPNFIEAKYIVTNGKEGNSLSNFNFAGTVQDQEGRILSSNVSVITTDAPGLVVMILSQLSQLKSMLLKSILHKTRRLQHLIMKHYSSDLC